MSPQLCPLLAQGTRSLVTLDLSLPCQVALDKSCSGISKPLTKEEEALHITLGIRHEAYIR